MLQYKYNLLEMSIGGDDMKNNPKMKTVKQLRKERGLYMKDVAKLLSISITGYAGKENGYRSWKTHEALLLASIFNYDIAKIIDFLPPGTRKKYKISTA